MSSLLNLLPHQPPMRLVEEVVEIDPGRRATCRRRTRPQDWFFDGHFPNDPVVPAVVLVELIAQTGGLAVGAGIEATAPPRLRVAALGPFKFPAAAGPGVTLVVSARCVRTLGGLFKIEGEVTADRIVVAQGAVTLAAVR